MNEPNYDPLPSRARAREGARFPLVSCNHEVPSLPAGGGDGWCCEAALSCILRVSRVVIGDPISYTSVCVHPFDDPSIRWVPEKENPAGYISVVTRRC